MGVRHRLAGDDLLRELDRVVAGNGEADAREALGARGVERADADQLALGVDERAAGVTGVDGAVDLDEVRVERVARGAGKKLIAGKGAHDALRDRLVEAEGAAHRHDPVAHLNARGVADLDRGDGGAVEVHLEHSDVGARVGADDRRVVGGAVDGDGDGLGAVDDVIVGDDVAVGVVDDAGAEARGGARGHVHGADGGQGLGGNGVGGGGVLVVRVDGDRLGCAGGQGRGALADDAGAEKHAAYKAGAHNAADEAHEGRLDALVVLLGRRVGRLREARLLAGDRRHARAGVRRLGRRVIDARLLRGGVGRSGIGAGLAGGMEPGLIARLGAALITGLVVLARLLGGRLGRLLRGGVVALVIRGKRIVLIVVHILSPSHGAGAPGLGLVLPLWNVPHGAYRLLNGRAVTFGA